MNSFLQGIKKNKDVIIKILVFLGIVMCLIGVMEFIFQNTILNLFKNLTKPYLEKAYSESKKLFITLSVLKGTADVIEGSSVNVSMILGMDVQVGDVIQPIYDIINILWKVSLASVVVLKLETIYYEIFKVKIANILILISLITYFPYTFFKNNLTEILKKISKYSMLVLIFVYIVMPVAILTTSGISNYFESEYKEPAVAQLNKSLNKLNKVKDELFEVEQSKSIFNIPAQVESAKERIGKFGKEITNVSNEMAENTPIIIGITLLSYLILPLIIAIFLYKLTKSLLLEKLTK